MRFNVFTGRDQTRRFESGSIKSAQINANLIDAYEKGFTVSTFIPAANMWMCVWRDSREKAIECAKESIESLGGKLNITRAYIHKANGHEFRNISAISWYLCDVVESK